MADHDLEKLLGAFAADTLTADERRLLYRAALDDQDLFNALADEQALKDLLDDADVRARLLQNLKQPSRSTAPASSWIDWLKQPGGLAFAGGLATVILAVVLGIRVYQDSLKQQAPVVATEDSPRRTPAPSTGATSHPPPAPTAEPDTPAKQRGPMPGGAAPQGQISETPAKRETSAPQSVTKPDGSGTGAESASARMKKDRILEPDAAPPTLPAPMAEKPQPASAPKAATEALSAQAAQEAEQQALAPQAPAAAAPLSARSLFYGSLVGADEQRTKSLLGESPSRADKPERKLDQFSRLNRVQGSLARSSKPLGLRYSFTVPEPSNRDRSSDQVASLEQPGSAGLTIEANQDSYLQVWQSIEAGTPQLIFPKKDSGQISFKMKGSQRQTVTPPVERGIFTIRLSLVPFGPVTRQESVLLGRPSPHQLQETTVSDPATGAPDHATYVVSQDPSPTAQISIEISR